ncbi:MAG: hypothetical protein IKX89_07570 [Firmicutes bacterium]|nr:hypothetical protein [Bacillota bacterium]
MRKIVTRADAARFCRLSEEELRMAGELGISPAALIRAERSSRTETWKDPAGVWVRKLYAKRRR